MPHIGYQNPGDLAGVVHAAAQAWFDGNENLAALMRGKGIPYVHMLQPNQYVEGSKKFTDRERKIAISDGYSKTFADDPNAARFASADLNRYVVPEGYKILRSMGPMVKGQNFIDGTMLFSEVEDEVYADDCCHMNRRGTEIMWAAILQQIIKSGLVQH